MGSQFGLGRALWIRVFMAFHFLAAKGRNATCSKGSRVTLENKNVFLTMVLGTGMEKRET